VRYPKDEPSQPLRTGLETGVQTADRRGMFGAYGEAGLSPTVFAACFLAGAVAIALWIEVRFPRLAPSSLRGAILHVGGTIVAAQLLTPLATHLLGGSAFLTLVSTFAVGFPALVYTLLVAIWVIRILRGVARGLLP
jgi:hypothetical protein